MTIHVLWLKKSKIPLSATSTGVSSEKELSDEVSGAKRETDDRQHEDDRDCDDAQALAELSHGTCWSRTVRSGNKESEPVTRTAPLSPASSRARASALPGSATVSTVSKYACARRAS